MGMFTYSYRSSLLRVHCLGVGARLSVLFTSFASLRKCMVYLWLILLRNGAIPKHYLSPRESVRSIQVSGKVDRVG